MSETTTNTAEVVNPNLPPKNVTSTVLKQVQALMDSKTLYLPTDYSVENALRSAWFYIQNHDDKDKFLACTTDSQANALYDMILQALDVSKDQGYFIAYATRLAFQRSYFGDIAVAKRVKPGIEPYFDVIRKGEAVRLQKVRTRYGLVTTVVGHDTPFPRESSEIVGAYCGFIDENGEDMGAEVMDWGQIQESWKKSKSRSERSFHAQQPDQASIRTVVRRRCKFIINTSNDEALLASIRRQDHDVIDAEMDEEIEKNANGEILGLTSSKQAELPPRTTASEAPVPAAPVTEKVATGTGSPGGGGAGF